jgi:beta-lactam-binding protein with PASTA domain
LLGVLVVLLAVAVLLVTSRASTSVTVPDLVGERVDPQLDGLRLRLAYEGLVLNAVSTATCPSVDLPGASLEELPGTIIDQHPDAGTRVVTSRAVDVTVCLPA